MSELPFWKYGLYRSSIELDDEAKHNQQVRDNIADYILRKWHPDLWEALHNPPEPSEPQAKHHP